LPDESVFCYSTPRVHEKYPIRKGKPLQFCEFIDQQKQVLQYLAMGLNNQVDIVMKSLLEKYGDCADNYNLQGVISRHRLDILQAIFFFAKALSLHSLHAEARLNLCITLCDTGFYNKAKEEYETFMLSQPPKQPPTCLRARLAEEHVRLAYKYFDQQMNTECLRELKKALDLDPDRTDLRVELGRVFFLLENYDQARHELQIALQNDSDNAELCQLFGLVEYFSRSPHLARLQWKKAYKKKSSNLVAKAYLKLTSHV